MSQAIALFGGHCASGVYRIDAAQCGRVLARTATPERFHFAILGGDAAGSREGFFTEIARALQFPSYFGRNWDAVYDCLTDLSWLPADGYVVVVDGFGRMAANEPEQWRIALKVFGDACAFWGATDRPMDVLLYDARAVAGDVGMFPERCLGELLK